MARESVEVFFSYARKDEALRDEMAKHLSNLKLQGIITDWYDRDIAAGAERDDEIKTRLNSADIILLLISADFMASDYIHKVEVRQAIARHELGEACVIPIILRPVDWRGASFSKLQALPKNAKPITTWTNQDEAFLDVTQGIRAAAERLIESHQPHELQSEQPEPVGQRLSPAQIWQFRLRNRRGGFALPLIWSLLVTASVIGFRAGGSFQSFELGAYDWLMRSRPGEATQDDRLLIIEIRDSDIRAQFGEKATVGLSLSDGKLTELLNKLKQRAPQAIIGLDIYRQSLPQLQTSDRLITICRNPDPTRPEDEGDSPPANTPKETLLKQVGFSNVMQDADKTVRRHLVDWGHSENQTCPPRFAFSFQIATRYLQEKGKLLQETPDGTYLLGNTKFPLLKLRGSLSTTGAYQAIDDGGYQMLLNYRTYGGNPLEMARRVSLKTFLAAPEDYLLPQNSQKPEIVLIGINAPDYGRGDDFWVTPYGGEKMPGIVLQAQMVSQILNAVENQRPLIRVWYQWQEILFVLSWSLVGGAIGWYFRPSLKFALIEGIAFTSLIGFCIFSFAQGIWLPLIPSVITLLVTSVGVLSYTTFQSIRSSQE